MPDPTSPPSDPFDRLVANVVALRAKGNWSTRALAQQAHVSRSSVVDLERGHINLSLDILDKLARALGVKTGSLLGQRPVTRDETEGLIEAVLAHNLVAARKRLALTQKQLSERSGVNRSLIANIERQARNPSLVTVARLAEGLGISVEVLLRG